MSDLHESRVELAGLLAERPIKNAAVVTAANSVRVAASAEDRARNAVADLEQRLASHIRRRGDEQARAISNGVEIADDAPDDFGHDISDKLIRARMRLSAATAAVESLADTHVAATMAVKRLEAGILAKAQHVTLLEEIEKAKNALEKWDEFVEAAEMIRPYAGLEINRPINEPARLWPPEIMAAIHLVDKLPVRDDLQTPINILRGEKVVEVHPYDKRVAELIAA